MLGIVGAYGNQLFTFAGKQIGSLYYQPENKKSLRYAFLSEILDLRSCVPTEGSALRCRGKKILPQSKFPNHKLLLTKSIKKNYKVLQISRIM